jgi:uncharacterized SAM-binding protein YcdF (DUF218 family)
MFFVLSKLLALAVAPAVWIVVAGLYGWLTKKPKMRRLAYRTAIGLTLLFSNGFVFNEVRRLYEPKERLASQLDTVYDYGIVLTGMTRLNRETGNGHFSEGSDRLMQALRLYGQGKVKRLIITGGSSRIFPTDYREATFLREWAIDIGIPAKDIVAESNARNTRENALFTAQWLQANGQGSALLITSATHMPRSLACFAKVGLVIDSFPADPAAARQDYGWQTFLLPNLSILSSWSGLFHEWIGFLAYRLAGYA